MSDAHLFAIGVVLAWLASCSSEPERHIEEVATGQQGVVQTFSMSVTLPMPSQRGHMPRRMVKVAFSVFLLPRSTVMAPAPLAEATLNE